MNLTIRNTINFMPPPKIPKKQEKVEEKIFFSNKKLRSKIKIKSKSLNVNKKD